MHSLKQQLLLLIIGPLLLLSLIGSALSATYIKDRAILATDNKAKSDLATGEEILNLMYPGPWEAEDGILYKGGVKISNNFEAVDRISSLTGDTVTIFLGDTRVSTTVRKRDGQRAVGTRVSREVDAKVLRQGDAFLGEANVVGEIYRTAYKPIRDENGNIIGMFYVGINKNLSNELFHKSLVTIIAITLALTVSVTFAAWYFTNKVIIKPLQMITESTRELAFGHLGGKVEVSSTNEIGELAVAFNQMVEGMQGFAQHINKVAGNERDTLSGIAPTVEKRPTVFEEKESEDVKDIPMDLPKGLNEATLKQILAFIEKKFTPMSAEEIGEGVNLTRVTARRYLEYLEQIGWVEVEQKYGTVGRPVKLYKALLGQR